MQKSDDTVDYGAAIRRAREEAGWSRRQLARATFFNDAYILRVERGERTATPNLVAAVEVALGVDIGGDMRRRELIKTFGILGTVTALPIDRLAWTETASHVGMTDVRVAWDQVRYLSTGDFAFANQATSLMPEWLKAATSLLDKAMSDQTKVELRTAVAALANRVSWIAEVSNNKGNALACARLAIQCSHGGNDATLTHLAIANAGWYISDTDPRQAVNAMDRALDIKSVHPTEMSSSFAIRARYNSQLGMSNEAMRDMRKSDQFDERPEEEAPHWAPYIDRLNSQRHRAQAWFAIGDPDRAEEICREWYYSSNDPDSASAALSRLAIASHEYGHRDHAQELVMQAERLAPVVTSARADNMLANAKLTLAA